MNLKSTADRAVPDAGPPNATAQAGATGFDRCLTLLAEGAALNVPEIDAGTYREFRAAVGALAMKIPDRVDDQEKLFRVKEIVQHFERHRSVSEAALRERLTAWRNLTSRLLRELLGSMGTDANTPGVAALAAKIASLTTVEDIRRYQESLDDFLRPRAAEDLSLASPLKVADRSTANDNAAGLRGGGAAVEHLSRVVKRGARGYVVLFQLGCLEMIQERFGMEAVEDCLMSVSAYLTHSLHSDDAIFHWSDSALMAVLLGRANDQILTAELSRIASHNRDISLNISGRTIMLRVPIEFNIAPFSRLRDPNDLYKFSQEHFLTR